MKKIVIAGSAKLPEKIEYWINYFNKKHYKVLDYPKFIPKERFIELYPQIHIEFLENITKTNMLFIMNEDKDGLSGYIGAEAFAELLFGLSQKLVYKKEIELYILKMPSKEVTSYEEVALWLKLGWIKIWKED